MGEIFVLWVYRGIEVWSSVYTFGREDVKALLASTVDYAVEKTEFWSSGIERITLDRKGMLVVTPKDPRSQMPYVKQLSSEDVEKLHQVA